MFFYLFGFCAFSYFIYYILFINNELLNAGIYNTINFIVICKDYINNYQYYLTNLKYKIKTLFYVEDKCITIINEQGSVLYELDLNEFSNLKINNTLDDYINICIFIEQKNINTDLYSSCISRFNDIHLVSKEYTMSNIKFLVPTINIKNTDNIVINKFDISNLFTNKNFYLVNNILFDKVFILWYLKYYCNFSENSLTNINYHISFIDNKMEHIILNDNQGIKLDLDLYTIIDN